MSSKPQVDQQARYIAGVSWVIVGIAAVFWIVQLIRGAAPGDVFLVVNTLFFAALAYMFGRLTRESGKVGVMPMLLFLPNALRFIRNPLVQQDLGVAGVVTFAAALGLFVADLALWYRQRRAQTTLAQCVPVIERFGLLPILSAAHRPVDGERYTRDWPRGSDAAFSVK